MVSGPPPWFRSFAIGSGGGLVTGRSLTPPARARLLRTSGSSPPGRRAAPDNHKPRPGHPISPGKRRVARLGTRRFPVPDGTGAAVLRVFPGPKRYDDSLPGSGQRWAR